MRTQVFESTAGVLAVGPAPPATPSPLPPEPFDPLGRGDAGASAEAFNTLGLALKHHGDVAGAIACFERAAEIDPAHAAAWNNLGWMHQIRGEYHRSLAVLERALELAPGLPAVHVNLALGRLFGGDARGANDACRRAVGLAPDSAEVRSHALVSMNYDDRVDEAGLLEAHAAWEPAVVAGSPMLAHAFERVREPRRELRVGFLSAYFSRHPIGFLVEPLWRELPAHGVHLVGVHSGTPPDERTGVLRALCAEWHPVAGLDIGALVEKTRALELDLLVDLDGHTRVETMLAVAQRLAPIQFAWLGYFSTTGVSSVDYLVADAVTVPPTSERYFTETILRMPGAQWCYQARSAPTTAAKPDASGAVTFGSFNNLAKLSDACVDAWCRILHATPGSRLELRALGLGDPWLSERVAARFGRLGVDPARIVTAGYAAPAEYHAALSRLDIALDPFPFSGGATSLDTLAAGVPIVTRSGDRLAGRLTETLLRHVGLDSLVGGSRNDYVERAVDLAGDPARLARIRGELPGRLRRSALCDAAGFAAAFAGLLRVAWRRYCDAPG